MKSLLFKEIIEEMKKLADIDQAKKMSDYMKGQFKFLGIAKPKLMKLIKPYLSKSKKEPIDWSGVYEMWDINYREAQYVALEYLNVHKKQITPNDLSIIKKLITTKSWWETVDNLDVFVGEMLLEKPSLEKEILNWSLSNNIWQKRISIDCQQKLKEQTNEDLLAKVIENNLGSDEFFINKAIGWSLREYSKTNPKWVKSFIKDNVQKLDKLSIKEAKKYL